MDRLSRMCLVLAGMVLLYALGVALAISMAFSPVLSVIVLAAVLVRLLRKGKERLTAFGTGRTATDENELRRAGLIGAKKGLILGWLVPNQQWVRLRAIWKLLTGKVLGREGCKRFLDALRGKDKGELVRLAQSIHISVFAPTRSGKGISCILPFLFTTDESLVCIDPKGENALIVSEHLRRKGFEIVILDPYKVVTQ